METGLLVISRARRDHGRPRGPEIVRVVRRTRPRRNRGLARGDGSEARSDVGRLNGLAEFAGGALLVLGLITPLGSAAVAGVMLVAIATVHWRNGFFNSNGGYEFNLLIVAAAIALAFTGPGTISIDDLAGWTLAGPEWGLAALGVSVVATGSVLAMRRPRPRAGTRRDVS